VTVLKSGSVFHRDSEGPSWAQEFPHIADRKMDAQRPPHRGATGAAASICRLPMCMRHLPCPPGTHPEAGFQAEALLSNVL
jgi:hypothetical protein